MSAFTLRGPRLSDFDDLVDMWSRPAVVAGTSRILPVSEDFIRSRLTNIPENVHTFVAETDGKVVGQGGITLGSRRQRHKADVAITVHEDYWSKGIGSALMEALLDIADNWCGVTRVQLDVLANNTRAIALYERMGFEREGVLRGDQMCNGELMDVIVMARLRPPLSPVPQGGDET